MYDGLMRKQLCRKRKSGARRRSRGAIGQGGTGDGVPGARGGESERAGDTVPCLALRRQGAAGKTAGNLVLVWRARKRSPRRHFGESVRSPEVLRRKKMYRGSCRGRDRTRDGGVTVVSWAPRGWWSSARLNGRGGGRGPKHDVHSSLEASVDRPAGTWCRHSTLHPRRTAIAAVQAFREGEAAHRRAEADDRGVCREDSEATVKKTLGVRTLGRAVSWLERACD